MFRKLLWGLTLLCVLSGTHGAAILNPAHTTTTTVATSDVGNATLPECPDPGHQRVSLEPDEFHVLQDGTLLVSGLRVNASSYSLNEDGATACLPPGQCEENFKSLRPWYYVCLVLILHFQVPMYVSCSGAFNKWSPLICLAVIGYSLFVAYTASPFCRQLSRLTDTFDSLWYSLPTYLSLVGLHMAGGLAALHSDPVLSHMVRLRQIFVQKGTVYIARRQRLAQGSLLSGALITLGTMAMALTYKGGRPDVCSLSAHMAYFLPSCLAYFLVNLLLYLPSVSAEGVPPAEISGDAWQVVRERHVPLLILFFAAFLNWIYGFLVTQTGCWGGWDPFVVVSVLHPVALCWYLFNNSRRVIFSDERCVKILETDGEVITVWKQVGAKRTTPAAGEKGKGDQKAARPSEKQIQLTMTSADPKKHQPDDKEKGDEEELCKKDFQLALVEKTSAKWEPIRLQYDLTLFLRKGERPEEVEVGLLVEKTGEEDAEKEYELAMVERMDPSKEERPADKKVQLAFLSDDVVETYEEEPRYQVGLMIKRTGADQRKKPVNTEYNLLWLKLPDLDM